MPRKNYTAAERALHILGTLAGKSRQEINDAIGKGDVVKMVPVERRKEIPQGSLDMLRDRYTPALGLLGQPTAILLWEHCVAPKKAGDL